MGVLNSIDMSKKKQAIWGALAGSCVYVHNQGLSASNDSKYKRRRRGKNYIPQRLL